MGVERVYEILEVERDLKDGARAFAKSGARGEVVWENVSFQYVAEQPVLKNINLSVKPGEKIAFVGPTGVGKSTLVSLIPRFYDPRAGRVLIDGADIRDYQLKSLRSQISMVLQPPLVFPVSVRDEYCLRQARSRAGRCSLGGEACPDTRIDREASG